MQPSQPATATGGVRTALSVLAVILAVAAIGINFAISGPAGADGATGPTGPQGPAGADGIDCWDLNQNGVPDVATEDRNGDTVVDVLDCAGPPGISGYERVSVSEYHTGYFVVTAPCPPGTRVLGGGHSWTNGTTDVWFWHSYPTPGGTGWLVEGTVNRGGASSIITAIAVCAFVT